MANKLELRGFRELKDELAALPTTVRDAAAPIELRHARRAQSAVVSAYPSVTGALRAGVKILERVPRGIATLYTLTTSAPHAHLYEFGTAHSRPNATFLPITEQARRAAVAEVSALVERQGLEVRGDRD